MDYQKLIEQIKTKIDATEFTEKDAEFRNDAKTFGIIEADVENYLVRRWSVYFSKATMSFGGKGTPVKVEGVFLGVSSNDFGVKRFYDKAVDEYN